MISFARGVPAPECLPDQELADCARVALERDGKTILSYGPSAGYGPLREWIAGRHDVDPARVFITNGSLQGFVFLAQMLTPGKRELVERALHDGDKPAFLYLIPTFQNPSGRTLDLERRRRIVEIAREHDLLV